MEPNNPEITLDMSKTVDNFDQINEIMQVPLRTTLQKQLQEQVQRKEFLEADKTNERIKKLKRKQVFCQKKALKARHQHDLKILQQSHLKQMTQFNELWDQKFNQYKQACKKGQVELIQRHQQEVATEKQRIQQTVSLIPKHSSEFLNLKKIQDTVIKRREYKQAHSLQQKMDQLQQGKHDQWREIRNDKIVRQMNQLLKRHELELENFKRKALSGFQELKRQKNSEMEALVKRYNNMKQDLTSAQKIEHSKMGKGGSMMSQTMSRMMTSRSALMDRLSPTASEEHLPEDLGQQFSN